ncbi:MAG: hypothetical protein HZB42_12285 [Sphingobacteriales bacterium]|nr:hypothetical protein [Sphingobacteriales bacterium]
MSKILSILLLTALLGSCNNHPDTEKLQARIDSLEKKLAGSYRPGFGEFMSSIQVHHAKLWFAGLNENWELAGFEMHEITENLDAIKKYQAERPESGSLDLMKPASDSVDRAISRKNLASFKNSYVIFTNACNDCHKKVGYNYNEVKIPETMPFSNQVFKKE